MEFVWFALVGLIAGFLAGQIMKGRGFGLVGNLVVGVIGAFIGGFISQLIGITASGMLGAIIVSTLGAILLLGAVSLVRSAA
jgi:uncharacterized membrane protein YeaQ/YmgE (transglycosylase-associated protein family)